MARILRGEMGWGIFPKLELVSVAIGGFCGYHLGNMSAVYKEGYLLRLERKVDIIKKKAAEALRDMDLYEKKEEEYTRSLRALDEYGEKLVQKERSLKKFEKELIERERRKILQFTALSLAQMKGVKNYKIILVRLENKFEQFLTKACERSFISATVCTVLFLDSE